MRAEKSRLEKTGDKMAPRLFIRVATRNTYCNRKDKRQAKRHVYRYLIVATGYIDDDI
jgi:hypothetical protein